MLVVLIAVGVATILALSFLASQGPTSVVAKNIDRKAKARQIAESALKMAIDYVNEDADWRTDKTNGQWMSATSLDGGTFELFGTDEDDGDLSDDTADQVLLSVVATFEGVTHRVSAYVTPGSGTSPSNRLLLVVSSDSSPSTNDQTRRTLFESWGYTVTYLDDSDSQADYDAAVAVNDVVYVSESCSSSKVNTKLRDVTIGVVTDEGYLHDEFGFTTSSSHYDSWTTTIDIIENTHPITTGFSTGSLTVFSSSIDTYYVYSTIASGVTVLAERPGTSYANFMVADTGDTLHHGAAAGRRVMFSGSDGMNFNHLGTDGQTLMRRSIEWAAGAAPTATGSEPTLLALYEFAEQAVADPELVGHWRLDETPSAGGGFGGVATDYKIEIKDGSYIDSYDSSLGSYGGANKGSNAYVATNRTSGNSIKYGTIYGDAYAGPGGSPGSVISSSVTGSTGTLATEIETPDYSAPSGSFTNMGDETYDDDNATWSSDLKFDELEIKDESRITVSGDVTIHVTKKLKLDDESRIELDPGASLTVYVKDDVEIKNESRVGSSSDAARIRFILYSSGKKFKLDDESNFSGTIESESEVEIKNESRVYGGVLSTKKIKLDDDSRISVDTSLPTSGGGGGGGGGSMPNAADQAAIGNDGSYQGDTAGGEAGFGDGGTAVVFDGSGDYLEIPHHADYLLDEGSVSFHVYPTALGGEQGLFTKDSSGNDNGGHLRIDAMGTSLRARLQTTSDDPYGTGSSFEIQSSTGVLSDDTWQHVAVTWGDGQLRAYVDGTLVASGNHLGGLGTTSGGSGNDEPIVIGASSDSSGNQSATPVGHYFTGRIDDVRIYDKPLDAGQATNLAGGSDPGSRTAPGYVIADTSGYDTAANMLIYDTTAISWVGGGGLEFTGDTIATTLGGVSKLHDAIEANGEFAVEIIIERASPASTSAPSHIFSHSNDPAVHNFMLGQDGSKYEVRLRDSATGNDGELSPDFVSSTDLASSGETHIVLSYSGGDVTVYIDGSSDQTATAGGTLDNWADDLFLVLGGTYDDTDHWNGVIKRIAIYDESFTQSQANNVYNGSSPGDGGGAAGVGSVRWDEQD